jgi:hypothetical protein
MMVIVRSPTLTVDDAEYRRQVRRYLPGGFRQGRSPGGANYYLTGAESMVSRTVSTFIPLTMPKG